MAKILVIDDEREITLLLEQAFSIEGYAVTATSDPEEGLQLLKHESFDIVITDLCMPGIDGLEVLRRSKTIRPSAEVVLITAYATVDTARDALKHGAVDYLTKPFSLENELKPLVKKILASSICEEGAEASDDAHRWSEPWDDEEGSADEVIAASPAMRKVLDRACKVARSDVNVLLRGKSGTGKEVLASLIHRRSSRSHKPMVTVNCAALPDTLLESELFGHTKGAFTGATNDRIGFFEAANGGTILLDEIGEVSTSFQPKLLRVLESGEFHRIGDAKQLVKVDVRIIAATNRDLEAAIRSGAFREDLYYRLNVVPLEIPALQERPEDIPALLDYFVQKLDRGRTFSPEAYEALLRYEWPGNVRELLNTVEHALVLSEGERIEFGDLPAAIQEARCNQTGEVRSSEERAGTLEEIEVHCIAQAMAKTGYNRTRAAGLLGISRRTLGYRIEKYGLSDQLESERQANSRTPAFPARDLAHMRAQRAHSIKD